MLLTLAVALLPLLDDRPLVEDLQRFPPLSVVDTQIAAADAYWWHLQKRIEWETTNYWALSTVAGEAANLRKAWQALRNACAYDHEHWKRESLKELREILGPDDYYAGRMPPCIPVWRLSWKDRAERRPKRNCCGPAISWQPTGEMRAGDDGRICPAAATAWRD